MKSMPKAKQQSTLKHGSITSTKQLGQIWRSPNLSKSHPILLADLSGEMDLPDTRPQYRVSAEVLEASEQQIYAFWLQVDATLICWLADPYELKIHSILEAWTDAGHMFVGLDTYQGVLLRTRAVARTMATSERNSMLSANVDIERFVRSATTAVESGLVKAHAKSEIDGVQKIRKLRVFLV